MRGTVRASNYISILVSCAWVSVGERRGKRDCPLVGRDVLNGSPLKLCVVVPRGVFARIGDNDEIPYSPIGNWLLEEYTCVANTRLCGDTDPCWFLCCSVYRDISARNKKPSAILVGSVVKLIALFLMMSPAVKDLGTGFDAVPTSSTPCEWWGFGRSWESCHDGFGRRRPLALPYWKVKQT